MADFILNIIECEETLPKTRSLLPIAQHTRPAPAPSPPSP